jgi:hypothetical protein
MISVQVVPFKRDLRTARFFHIHWPESAPAPANAHDVSDARRLSISDNSV